eukprot:TRINITY_DN4091_c0_g2_i2.p1 TRINITY_DN4091_c0_g2~~TRINITY_DN4091_c0_g2_i2.p1  ORF type:complete len:322 (+),score=74.45 TRINITY_DN4091_c0_g2_i2:38-967(+)
MKAAMAKQLVLLLVSLPCLQAGKSGGSKACSHTGFFTKKVVPLCEQHFPDDQSKHAWVVQFYHPYVKKCVETRGAYEELAADPKLGAKIGAVDCQQNGEFCAKHGISEAPTTRAFFRGNLIDFEGEHSLDGLQKFVKGSADRFKEMEKALACEVKGVFTDPKKDAAVPLCVGKTPPSVDAGPWLVSFYESGDRNKDKTMRSVMNKLAEKFGNAPPKKTDKKKTALKLRVGAVECSDQGGCASMGISSFPAVRIYSKGADPVDYDSFFDREEIQKWANGRLKELSKAKAEVLKADIPEGEKATPVGEGEL